LEINKIIASLIAVGGLGFINYYVADRQGLVDFRGQDSKTQVPYMLCWSIFDFAIYLIVQSGVVAIKNKFQSSSNQLGTHIFMGDSGIAISLLLTIVVVFFISAYLYRPFSTFINSINNRRRNGDNKASLFNGDPWTSQFITNKEKSVFVYSFERKPIISGYLTQITTNPQDFRSMSIMPFNDDVEMPKYEDALNKLNEIRDNFTVMQYVDYDQKFLIISLEAK